MIIKFNIDVFTPQLTDLRSADLGMTSSFSVKQSKKTQTVITWPNNRKLNITSCSWRVLNTDTHVDVRASVDRQAERPVDASESPKFLNASFPAFGTSTLTGSAVLLEASVPQRRLWEQELPACRSRQLPAGELLINSLLSCNHLLLQQTSRAPNEWIGRCSRGDRTTTFRWRHLLWNNQEQTIQEGINER